MDEKQMREHGKMTALVIGATGLVGKAIVERLLQDERVGEVHCFVRRSTGLAGAKLREHLVDFNRPEDWKDLLKGDVLFSALGTTRAQAGSKEAQWRVDYDYQFETAKTASENGVERFVLISSVGADASSAYFYLNMKGKLDEAVCGLGFKRVDILRPGPLTGPRENRRKMEEISAPVMRLLAKLPGLSAYRPISGAEVAKAAVHFGFGLEGGRHVHGPESLFEVG